MVIIMLSGVLARFTGLKRKKFECGCYIMTEGNQLVAVKFCNRHKADVANGSALLS